MRSRLGEINKHHWVKTMNITITEKKDNRLMERWEVQGVVTFEQATPANKEFVHYIGEHFQVDPAQVIMKGVHTKYGHRQASFQALVYHSAAALQATEPMTAHLKKKREEQKKSEKKEEA